MPLLLLVVVDEALQSRKVTRDLGPRAGDPALTAVCTTSTAIRSMVIVAVMEAIPRSLVLAKPGVSSLPVPRSVSSTSSKGAGAKEPSLRVR